jgi:hypothetical protein
MNNWYSDNIALQREIAERYPAVAEMIYKHINALQRISQIDYKNADHNRCAYDAVCIARAAIEGAQ